MCEYVSERNSLCSQTKSFEQIFERVTNKQIENANEIDRIAVLVESWAIIFWMSYSTYWVHVKIPLTDLTNHIEYILTSKASSYIIHAQ